MEFLFFFFALPPMKMKQYSFNIITQSYVLCVLVHVTLRERVIKKIAKDRWT